MPGRPGGWGGFGEVTCGSPEGSSDSIHRAGGSPFGDEVTSLDEVLGSSRPSRKRISPPLLPRSPPATPHPPAQSSRGAQPVRATCAGPSHLCYQAELPACTHCPNALAPGTCRASVLQEQLTGCGSQCTHTRTCRCICMGAHTMPINGPPGAESQGEEKTGL